MHQHPHAPVSLFASLSLYLSHHLYFSLTHGSTFNTGDLLSVSPQVHILPDHKTSPSSLRESFPFSPGPGPSLRLPLPSLFAIGAVSKSFTSTLLDVPSLTEEEDRAIKWASASFYGDMYVLLHNWHGAMGGVECLLLSGLFPPLHPL